MKKQFLLLFLLATSGIFAKAQELAWSSFSFPKDVFSTDNVILLDTLKIDPQIKGYHYLSIGSYSKTAPNYSKKTHFRYLHSGYHSKKEKENLLPFKLGYSGAYDTDKQSELIADTLGVSYYQDKKEQLPIYIKLPRKVSKKRLELRFIQQKKLENDSLEVFFELKNNSDDSVLIETSFTACKLRSYENRYTTTSQSKPQYLLPFGKIMLQKKLSTVYTSYDSVKVNVFVQGKIKKNRWEIEVETGLSALKDAPIADVPVISYQTMVINRGLIPHKGDRLFHFPFRNTGNVPLIITCAKGSCGCVVPTYPKEPILPGQTAQIDVNYDTNRVGAFTKTVTVTCNDPQHETTVLTIVGNVFMPPSTENTTVLPEK